MIYDIHISEAWSSDSNEYRVGVVCFKQWFVQFVVRVQMLQWKGSRSNLVRETRPKPKRPKRVCLQKRRFMTKSMVKIMIKSCHIILSYDKRRKPYAIFAQYNAEYVDC